MMKKNKFVSVLKKAVQDKHIQNSLSVIYFILAIFIPLFLNTKKPYIYSIALLIIYIAIRLSKYYLKEYPSSSSTIKFVTFILIIVIGYISNYFVESTEPIAFETHPPRCQYPVTLHDYFSCNGYPENSFLIAGFTYTNNFKTYSLKVEMGLVQNFKANSFFYALYIPKTDSVARFCKAIVHLTDSLITLLKDSLMHYEHGNSVNNTNLMNLTFTGRVIIYNETPIIESEKIEIYNMYRQQNKYVLFYSSDFSFLDFEKKFIWRFKGYKPYNK